MKLNDFEAKFLRKYDYMSTDLFIIIEFLRFRTYSIDIPVGIIAYSFRAMTKEGIDKPALL